MSRAWRVSADLAGLPFYRARLDVRGVPAPWSIEDLEDFAAAADDPYGGRVAAGARVDVALQLEATSEPPVWSAFTGAELDHWAAGLARVWQRLGLGRGETIAFFDYGSNPAVLLSTQIFVARLRRGATERLGATAICNDGVASMTGRLLGILESVKPTALVVRRDLVAPLVDLLATRGLPGERSLRWAAVVDTEGAPPLTEATRLRETLGVPVRRLFRADAACLIAADCEVCGGFHLDRRLHDVEALADGDVAVTARFARLCPVVRYRLLGATTAGTPCGEEPGAARVECA